MSHQEGLRLRSPHPAGTALGSRVSGPRPRPSGRPARRADDRGALLAGPGARACLRGCLPASAAGSAGPRGLTERPHSRRARGATQAGPWVPVSRGRAAAPGGHGPTWPATATRPQRATGRPFTQTRGATLDMTHCRMGCGRRSGPPRRLGFCSCASGPRRAAGPGPRRERSHRAPLKVPLSRTLLLCSHTVCFWG